jgi:hypothetical protein
MATNNTGFAMAMTVGDPSAPVLAVAESPATGGSHTVVKRMNGGAWGPVGANLAESTLTGFSLGRLGDGNPLAVWQQGSLLSIQRLSGGAWGAYADENIPAGLIGSPALATDAAGHAVIGAVDANGVRVLRLNK